MTCLKTNGRPQRKQLSDQIDRLDAILDGLSDALSGAVAEAVREGAHLALKDAFVEIMTDPILRAKLHQTAAFEPPATTTPAQPPRSFSSWLKAKAAAALTGAKAIATSIAKSAVSAVGTIATAIRHPTRLVETIIGCKHLLYLGAAAGIAVALVSFFAPHVVSAALSGLSGGVAAIAVQAALWTRRTLQSLTINLT